MELTNEDKKLIDEAKEIINKRKTERIPPRNSRMTAVGSALITKKGNIYRGVNIETQSAPCSICAEYSAIATMYNNGENEINTIISIDKDGNIMPPCGKCREFIYEVSNKNKDVNVIINNNQKIKLKELLPYPWQDN